MMKLVDVNLDYLVNIFYAALIAKMYVRFYCELGHRGLSHACEYI